MRRRSGFFVGDPAVSFHISSIVPRTAGFVPGDPEAVSAVDLFVVLSSIVLFCCSLVAGGFAGRSFVIKTAWFCCSTSPVDGSRWKLYCLTKGSPASVLVVFLTPEVG